MSEDLVHRLKKRAEIRRQITDRKSVQEGKPDRIADLLEEAARALETREWVNATAWRGLTQDEIRLIAQESKKYAEHVTPQGLEWFDAFVQHFAQQVSEIISAKEREACAVAANEFLTKGRSPLGQAVSDVIRARGEA